jgi:predicted Fe-Mo cluster-binding NifX family protein
MYRRNFNMKRIFFLSLTMLFLVSAVTYAGQEVVVKIGVASNNKKTTFNVGATAGRSPYYLMFDSTGKLVEVIENPYKDARGGAGPSTADFLAEKGVTIAIAETFGGKMINAMKSKGITYFEIKGNVKDAVKKVLNPK